MIAKKRRAGNFLEKISVNNSLSEIRRRIWQCSV